MPTIKQQKEILARLGRDTHGFLYRFSTEKDKDCIDGLLKLCFGDRSGCGALDDLDGRYLLAFHKNKLIAMTGIGPASESDFIGKEVDWTCCHSAYRRMGLITGMLRALLEPEKSYTIFCSCYREPGKDKANLDGIMGRLGFECVLRGYKTFCDPFFDACFICNFRQERNCVCHEDLYRREPSTGIKL